MLKKIKENRDLRKPGKQYMNKIRASRVLKKREPNKQIEKSTNQSIKKIVKKNQILE